MKRSSRKNFSGELEQGLDEWETDTLLTYPQPLAALYTEWMDNDFSFWDSIRGTGGENSGETGGGSPPLRVPCQWGPPVEMKDFTIFMGTN